ncbi:MAG TPA: response regulator [Thermoanaerobaculia bacterium]|nr:response regulator [Thermoanaerobaculia bacterium]
MRVLIIDVDPDVRRRLSLKLLRNHVRADTVSDASEAIELLGKQEYAFVLLDTALPDSGVIDVLARAAAMPVKERPIIVVTTASMESARALDVELVQIMLRKPIDVDAVADLIGNCVRQTPGAVEAVKPQPSSQPR